MSENKVTQRKGSSTGGGSLPRRQRRTAVLRHAPLPLGEIALGSRVS